MKRTVETCKRALTLWSAQRAGYLLAASALGLLVCIGLSVYASESERREGQPEILASTNKFYPAGWQILTINPATGEFRNVSNLLTADN